MKTRATTRFLFFLLCTTLIVCEVHGQWSGGPGNLYNLTPGSIGIGTTAPASLLHVAGSIRTGIPSGGLGGAAATNGSLLFYNSGNTNTITISSGTTTTSYPLTLPILQGAVNSRLANNGSGVLSWAPAGSIEWLLAGNTLLGSEFLGSLNDQALTFKVFNNRAGRIESNTQKYSTSLGYLALNPSNTGNYNTAFGYNALMANTTGQKNIAVGSFSQASNTTGYENTTLGHRTLANNTTGIWNIAIGSDALYSSTYCLQNTAVGFQALMSMGSGQDNTALGMTAMSNFSSGNNNTAVGSATSVGTTATNATALGYGAVSASNQVQLGNSMVTSLYCMGAYVPTTTDAPNLVVKSTGQILRSTKAAGDAWFITGNAGTIDNVNFFGTTDAVPLTFKINSIRAGRIENAQLHGNSFGYQALSATSTGAYNNAFGYEALFSNTTGSNNTAMGEIALRANTTGSNNSASGYRALFSNTVGIWNTAQGASSLFSNNTGNNNTGTGAGTLFTNTSGSANTAAGYQALINNTTGGNNTAVGLNALSGNGTGSCNTALGSNANVASAALTNATAIGCNASATASNMMQLGDGGVTSLYCMGAYVPTTTASPNMVVLSTGQILRSSTLPGTGDVMACGTRAVDRLTRWSNITTKEICNSNVFNNGNGNVGIDNGSIFTGASQPNKKLHIIGAGQNDGIRISYGGTSQTGAAIWMDGNQVGGRSFVVHTTGINNHQGGQTTGQMVFRDFLKQYDIMRIDGNNLNVGIGGITPNASYRLDVNGNLLVRGDCYINGKLTVMSDSLVKKNITGITNALATINQLQVKQFDYRVTEYPYLNLPPEHAYGFLAQQVRTVLPALVDTTKIAALGGSDTAGGTGYTGGNFLNLNYVNLIPFAIRGIQELDASVNNISASVVYKTCTLGSNYLTKATDNNTVCNSMIYDNGTGVAIGTTTIPAGYKMVIEGKLGARDVMVACTPTWPDYVFEKSHLLTPLEDVAEFVSANKHLPGIPSQGEIEKAGGLNLGEMQTRQMEKIEELYLYIIEINKSMQKLTLENQELKDRLQKMENN